MPRLPNLINRPDLIHRLQQFFGIHQLSVTPQLGPQIQPVVVVGDLQTMRGQRPTPFHPVEVAPCMLRRAVLASVGNFSIVRMRNPIGSGVVARVVGFQGYSSTGSFLVGLALNTNTDLPNLFNGAITDTRFQSPFSGSFIPGNPRIVCSTDQRATSLLVDSIGIVETDPSTYSVAYAHTFAGQGAEKRDRYYPVVLDEGSCLQFGVNGTNIGILINVQWEEEPKSSQ